MENSDPVWNTCSVCGLYVLQQIFGILMNQHDTFEECLAFYIGCGWILHAVWVDNSLAMENTLHFILLHLKWKRVCHWASKSVWQEKRQRLLKLPSQLWYLTPQGLGSFLSQMASVQWKKAWLQTNIFIILTYLNMSPAVPLSTQLCL